MRRSSVGAAGAFTARRRASSSSTPGVSAKKREEYFDGLAEYLSHYDAESPSARRRPRPSM